MSDEAIESAISHWAPRFTTQGVDPNDFRRVTAALHTWADWLDGWCANGDEHAALANQAEAAGNWLTAGEAWQRATLSYHFSKFVWVLDMDRHLQATLKAVAARRRALELLDPTAQRLKCQLDGETIVGNLRLPATPADRSGSIGRPGLVLLLPGLDSAKEEFHRWEDVFLRRGMATFSLDGPGAARTLN